MTIIINVATAIVFGIYVFWNPDKNECFVKCSASWFGEHCEASNHYVEDSWNVTR